MKFQGIRFGHSATCFDSQRAFCGHKVTGKRSRTYNESFQEFFQSFSNAIMIPRRTSPWSKASPCQAARGEVRQQRAPTISQVLRKESHFPLLSSGEDENVA